MESKLSSKAEELEKKYFEKLLLPGDVLIYARSGFYSWLIRHATNGPATHTETYIGGGKTIASRNGLGVATYDFDPFGLYLIWRPKGFINIKKMLEWQKTVEGWKYDWTGLWRSFVENKWGKRDKAMWCSEHTTAAQRAGDHEPFNPETPADSIDPNAWLRVTPYTQVWRK